MAISIEVIYLKSGDRGSTFGIGSKEMWNGNIQLPFLQKPIRRKSSLFHAMFIYSSYLESHLWLVDFVTLLLYAKTIDICSIYIVSPKIICHFCLFGVLGIAS